MTKKNFLFIIAAVIFISGFGSLGFGLFQKSCIDEDLPVFEPFSISEEDVGVTFQGSAAVDIMPVEETENGFFYILCFYESAEDDAEYTAIGFDVPASQNHMFENTSQLDFSGTVQKCDDVMMQTMQSYISDYLTSVYEMMEMEMPEGEIEYAYERISPYYIELSQSGNGNFLIMLGIVLMTAALILCFAVWFGKKFLLVLAVLAVVLLITAALLLKDKVRTMASVQEITDGFYSMTYSEDYQCDAFLNANISTNTELIEWIQNNLFYGIPFEVDMSNFGCSAFSAVTSEGDRLMGRNFDYDETETLIVHTDPEDGYASCGMVDLKFFGIGTDSGMIGTSIPARAYMLAAPYVCMDGVNEAGVGVGILQLDMDEVHQDNGKPELLIYSAIRGILDKCASVDEAIAFLDFYDMHSALSCSYHLFIADKSGRAVVVEWIGNETKVTESAGCTNHLLCEDAYDFGSDTYERFDTITSRLDEMDGVLTQEEAMTLLSDVSWHQNGRGTEWSCVYNLTDFSVDICLDGDYEAVYSFSCKDGLSTDSIN